MTIVKRTLTTLLAAVMTIWMFVSSAVTVYSADSGVPKTEIISFGGADCNENGLYPYDAFRAHLAHSIGEYDRIIKNIPMNSRSGPPRDHKSFNITSVP